MSCIAGLFHRGGATVDERHLLRMLDRMRARAPHGDATQVDGRLAFGHALLRTGTSAAEGPAPLVIDGIWICGDARLDDRAALVKGLSAKGVRVDEDATPASLLVAAYRALGDDFVERLTGDFAFALWDPTLGRLTCARDPLGVRPFHYAEYGDLFAFASDPDALLALPGVSRELDEISVADFLIFTAPREAHRTIYRDVRCLPPATVMQVSATGSRQRTYWEVPVDAPEFGRSPAEHVHGFSEVFRQAVADRMPHGPVATHLSGGIDSTAIAAVAIAARGAHQGITAYNISTARLMPDDAEERFARMAASYLDVDLVVQDLTEYRPYGSIVEAGLWTPSPQIYPFMAAHRDLLLQIERSGAHVLLAGHGGDAVMSVPTGRSAMLLRSGRLAELASELVHHVLHTRSLRGSGLRTALFPRARSPAWTPPMPTWLDPAFAARVQVDDRWRETWARYADDAGPRAQLTQPWFSRNFEALESPKLPVVVRYPFYDKRVVEYLAGVPNFMRAGKRVLRESMSGRLPEAILGRPKTSFPGDLLHAMVAGGRMPPSVPGEPGAYPEAVRGAIHAQAMSDYAAGKCPDSTWTSLLMFAPVALMGWLRSLEANERVEKRHGGRQLPASSAAT